MEWKSPFIVYRLDQEGKLAEVFHAAEVQKAKYWLSYIAEVGDLLTKSPAHPRNATGRPEYWSHKESSGKAVMDKEKWLQMKSIPDFEAILPKEQQREPENA